MELSSAEYTEQEVQNAVILQCSFSVARDSDYVSRGIYANYTFIWFVSVDYYLCKIF